MTVTAINPLFYIHRLRDLGRFLVSPKHDPPNNISVLDKITSTTFILIVTLIFSVSSHIAIYYFIQPRLSASFIDLITMYNSLGFFFLSIIIVPFVEEAYYRLPLQYSSVFISIACSILFHHIITKSFFHLPYYNYEDFLLSRIAFSAVGGFVMYLVISRLAIDVLLNRIWTKHFKLIFYVICIAFAWAHIENFQRTSYNAILGPVLVLPQFFLGLTTGFVRVRYGFLYSVLLHASYNSSLYWLTF